MVNGFIVSNKNQVKKDSELLGYTSVSPSPQAATTAKKVYLSHNLPKKPTQLPSNMEQVAGIARCTGPKSFQLTDGDCFNDVDTVMFCTGYEYSFPFLDRSCKASQTSHTLQINLKKYQST